MHSGVLEPILYIHEPPNKNQLLRSKHELESNTNAVTKCEKLETIVKKLDD